jgi:hypothetical protein
LAPGEGHNIRRVEEGEEEKALSFDKDSSKIRIKDPKPRDSDSRSWGRPRINLLIERARELIQTHKMDLPKLQGAFPERTGASGLRGNLGDEK